MEERFKYLFQRYLDNSCTRKEFEEFLSYMAHAEHDAELRALIRKVYENTGEGAPSDSYVDTGGNLVLPKPEKDNTGVRPRHKRRKIVVALTIAACLVWVAGYFFTGDKEAPAKRIAYDPPVLTKKSTDRSENKYLLLPDSTQVWLNAESSLEFPGSFDKNSRVVYLSGEAYFDVKHADKTPFVIHTGKVTTTVLGTAFNIKAYPGRKDVIVSVSRGKVKVNFDDEEVATLIRGQQVKVSHTDKRVVEKKTAQNEAASWQQGNLVYDDEQLQDIIADLERVYDVRIRMADTSVSQLRISTSFRREIGVEYALQVLCELTDTELKQADGRYIIQ